MYKTISCLPLALASFAVFTTLYGCSATLPSHDGSLHSVYGIENSVPTEATTLTLAEPQQIAPIETYEPTVQTLSTTGVIASTPITSIISEELVLEKSELAPSTLPMEGIQTEPAKTIRKDHEHKLGAGETLFSVARDLTGSSNNWKVIADYNSIANPGAITVGQSIVIPSNMLIRNASDEELSSAFDSIKTEKQTGPQPNIVVSANGTQEIELAALENIVEPTPTPPTYTPQAVISSSETAINARTKGSLEKSIANFASIIKTNFKLPATLTTAVIATKNPTVSSQINEPPALDATIKTAMQKPNIIPELKEPITAKPNSTEAIRPLLAQQNTLPEKLDTPPAASKQAEQWIKVDGNFTPKAIYKGAGYTTGLLMRVSPGSKFKLTSKTDDWYEIETDQGVGYIFHRDVLVPQ